MLPKVFNDRRQICRQAWRHGFICTCSLSEVSEYPCYLHNKDGLGQITVYDFITLYPAMVTLNNTSTSSSVITRAGAIDSFCRYWIIFLLWYVIYDFFTGKDWLWTQMWELCAKEGLSKSYACNRHWLISDKLTLNFLFPPESLGQKRALLHCHRNIICQHNFFQLYFYKCHY